MNRRWFVWRKAIGLLLLGVILVSGSITHKAFASEDQITLKLLLVDVNVYVNGINDIIKEFEKTSAGKNVKFQIETAPFTQLFAKEEVAAAGGSRYDIMMIDGPLTKHFAYYKILTPIGSHLSAFEKNQWVKPSIVEGSYKGQLYTVPLVQSLSMMFYNKSMTDAANIYPPQTLKDAWTYQEALNAWQKTTVDNDGDGKPEIWGFWASQGTSRNDYTHGLFQRMAGSKKSKGFTGINTDGITIKGHLDSPESVKGLQAYQDLYQVNKVSPLEPLPNMFFSGKVAFIFAPDNYFGELKRLFPNGGFKMGVTPIPVFPGGTQMSHTGSWHLGIPVTTTHLNKAVAFLRFASGFTGAKIMYSNTQQIPAQKKLLNMLPEYNEYPKRLFKEGLEKIGVARIQTPGYQEYQVLEREMLDNIARGANVRETVAAYADRMTAALAKYKGWDK